MRDRLIGLDLIYSRESAKQLDFFDGLGKGEREEKKREDFFSSNQAVISIIELRIESSRISN